MQLNISMLIMMHAHGNIPHVTGNSHQHEAIQSNKAHYISSSSCPEQLMSLSYGLLTTLPSSSNCHENTSVGR